MKSRRKPVRWYCGRKNDGEDWSGWMHDWIHRRWKSCAKECTWIMSLHFSHSSTNNSFNYKTTGQLGYQLLNEVSTTLTSNTIRLLYYRKKKKQKKIITERLSEAKVLLLLRVDICDIIMITMQSKSLLIFSCLRSIYIDASYKMMMEKNFVRSHVYWRGSRGACSHTHTSPHRSTAPWSSAWAARSRPAWPCGGSKWSSESEGLLRGVGVWKGGPQHGPSTSHMMIYACVFYTIWTLFILKFYDASSMHTMKNFNIYAKICQ